MTLACANIRCDRDLDVDHVTVTTTAHVRRFCSMHCVVEGFQAHQDQLYADAARRTAAEAARDALTRRRARPTLGAVARAGT
jgi:hypothetical protein